MRKITMVVAFLALTGVYAEPRFVSADTIQFTDFTHSDDDPVDWLVTIDDNTAGLFTVNVGISQSSPNRYADITGVAFSISGALEGPVMLTAPDIDDLSAGGEFVAAYIGPSSKFGEGDEPGSVNFQGGTPTVGDFDAALGYRAGEPFLTSVRFTVSTLEGKLGLEDWKKFGVRGQFVGDTEFGNGSSKDWSTTVSAVPAPSAVVGLLGLAATLGGLTYWRKRQ